MELSNVRLGGGNHPATAKPTGDRDMCIMEAVAAFAGEPWSDHPACASPVVSRFLQVWNDMLSDEDRDRLLPASVWVPALWAPAAMTPRKSDVRFLRWTGSCAFTRPRGWTSCPNSRSTLPRSEDFPK